MTCQVEGCGRSPAGIALYTWTPPWLDGARVAAETRLCVRHMAYWNLWLQEHPEVTGSGARDSKIGGYDAIDRRIAEAIAERLGERPEDSDRGFTRTQEEDYAR